MARRSPKTTSPAGLPTPTARSFERMFAIDHQKLVAAGESIMDADGDFGRMLFEAAAGVTNLTDIRKLLEAEAKDLWGLPRRKEAQFSQAEDRFTAAKAKLNEVVLSSGAVESGRSGVEGRAGGRSTADAELAAHATRQRQLERIKRVATPLQRYHEAQRRERRWARRRPSRTAPTPLLRTAEAAWPRPDRSADRSTTRWPPASTSSATSPSRRRSPAHKHEIAALAARPRRVRRRPSRPARRRAGTGERWAAIATAAARPRAGPKPSPTRCRPSCLPPWCATTSPAPEAAVGLVHAVDSAHRDQDAKRDRIDAARGAHRRRARCRRSAAADRGRWREAQALNYADACAAAPHHAPSAKTAAGDLLSPPCGRVKAPPDLLQWHTADAAEK